MVQRLKVLAVHPQNPGLIPSSDPQLSVNSSPRGSILFWPPPAPHTQGIHTTDKTPIHMKINKKLKQINGYLLK